MIANLKQQLQNFIFSSISPLFPNNTPPSEVLLESPADKAHGDFSTNAAMRSTKILKKKPMDIARIFADKLQVDLKQDELGMYVKHVEVCAPGFINIFLSEHAMYAQLQGVLSLKEDYGRSDIGNQQSIQIEFVSANPTGPLSIAHARQAAVGDALGNILTFIGFDVSKEYYVNDEGNQINILGNSIKLRLLELMGEDVNFPEDCYQGDYIRDMAEDFKNRQGIETTNDVEEIDDKAFCDFGVKHLLNVIKVELDEFGVSFDVWAHQSKIADTTHIDLVLKELDEKGFLYEKDGALWFKSTQFGDDKDRVIRKTDGAYTYLTPDIAYHKDKFDRGFSKVWNIWGPDHHGYIPRIKASVAALGKDPNDLEVLIVQLATIYRDGKPISMSTRRGQYVSLREVLDEVGSDAARYFFLMRHIKAHLDFDLELAKKETSENPVFYIQYAYARVFSIHKKAKDAGLTAKLSEFEHLKEREEQDLIFKMGFFSIILQFCYEQRDPYPLVNYLAELAGCFHKFYDKHRVVDLDTDISSERLALIDAARIVLGNGLKLLGVSRPQQM